MSASECSQVDRVVRPIRCPKCRGVDLLLREHIHCSARWYPGADEGYNDTGDYWKVTGECSCGHNWTLRGHSQVWTELRERLAENDRLLKANRCSADRAGL